MKYEITLHVTGDPVKEGRISAFRQGAEFFDREADKFPVGSAIFIGFRRAALKMFAWMEQEISK